MDDICLSGTMVADRRPQIHDFAYFTTPSFEINDLIIVDGLNLCINQCNQMIYSNHEMALLVNGAQIFPYYAASPEGCFLFFKVTAEMSAGNLIVITQWGVRSAHTTVPIRNPSVLALPPVLDQTINFSSELNNGKRG